ncbi:hypothetical protein PG985_007720 [Apiospora marii]|uniref:Uncharacterized protein n=1 Tax=Apiospora marii TaxID=335849 RepID=A0ABR1SS17_9PEZI
MSSSTSTSTSAAQEVFGIPELVALIVDFIYENLQVMKPNHGDGGIFDRTKYADIPGSIIPVLWRHPTQVRTDPCLTALFWNIDSERRSMYAQYIESGTLVFTGARVRLRAEEIRRTTRGETEEQLLAAVDFPRLKILHARAQFGYRLPKLGSDCVEYILFDTRGRHYEFEEFWGDLLELEKTFKALLRLHFYKDGPFSNRDWDLVMVVFANRMTKKREAELGSGTPFSIDGPVFERDPNRFPVP